MAFIYVNFTVRSQFIIVKEQGCFMVTSKLKSVGDICVVKVNQ